MKNQYAGDVGDFSKFALLKSLRDTFREEQIGILWYLTPDDPSGRGPKDGGLTGYERLRDIDSNLFQVLHSIAKKGPRRVSEFRRRGLTEGMKECDELLDTSVLPPPLRPRARDAWFQRALAEVADCPFVLLDPDNGMATKSVKLTQARASKFALESELNELHAQDRTVIYYQHAGRRESFDYLLRRLISNHPGSFALRWHVIQARAYLVWPAANRDREVERWGQELSNVAYRTRFTMISEHF